MILTWATGWMPLNDEYKRNNKRKDRKEEFGFETTDQLGMTLAARNNLNQQSLSNRHLITTLWIHSRKNEVQASAMVQHHQGYRLIPSISLVLHFTWYPCANSWHCTTNLGTLAFCHCVCYLILQVSGYMTAMWLKCHLSSLFNHYNDFPKPQHIKNQDWVRHVMNELSVRRWVGAVLCMVAVSVC